MRLPQKAINILVCARHNKQSRATLDSKADGNLEGALKAMISEAGGAPTAQAPCVEPPSAEAIAELDRWLRHMRHTRPGLKTVESRTRAAVRLCGIALPDGRGNLPLSRDWLAVKAAIARHQWTTLLPLAFDANNRGLTPAMLSDAILTDYSARHLANHDRKSAGQTVRAVSRTWNEVAPALGLEGFSQPLPHADRGQYKPHESDYAPSLLAELDLCVASWMTVPRRGRRLNPNSARAARYSVLLTIAAFCRAHARKVGEIKSLLDFITIPNLTTALDFMIVRAQRENPNAVRTDGTYNCGRAMRDAAQVVLPTAHELHASLSQLVWRLSPGAKPNRADLNDGRPGQRRRPARKRTVRLPSAKKQRALLPVTDPEYAALLRSTPAVLYAELSEHGAPGSEFVTRLIHACALELMMATSLWPYHVAGLRLGRHLQVVPDGNAIRYRIRVSAEETNHAVARDCEIIGESARILHLYLTRIRPQRVAPSSDWLFAGRKSSSYHTNALSQAVCRLVTDVTGHRISAKDLRAAVAVMYGLGPEGSDAVIQRFLARKQTDNDPIVNLVTAWKRSQHRSSGSST